MSTSDERDTEPTATVGKARAGAGPSTPDTVKAGKAGTSKAGAGKASTGAGKASTSQSTSGGAGAEVPAADVTTTDATADVGEPVGRRPLVLAVVAAVVAAVLLGGAVTGLVRATSQQRTQTVGEQRDAALEAARSIAGTLTTVNGADVNGTLDSWDAVVAGPLADEFANSRAQIQQRADQTQANVASTITGAALTQLDVGAGTAAALVFVDTSTSNGPATPALPSSSGAAPTTDPSTAPSSGAPASASPSSAAGGSTDPSAAPSTAPAPSASDARTQRLALSMTMTKQDGRWRAIDLQPVAQGAAQ